MNFKTVSKKLLFVFFGAALMISSCKKHSETGGDPGAPSKKLIRLEENATNYSTFDYNTDGTLKKMTSVEDDAEGTETTVINYTYNAQGKISESNIDGAIQFKYLYANNKVDKLEMFTGNMKVIYYVFEYNNNKLSKITKYTNEGTGTNEDFKLSGRTECSYFDNGNTKEIKEYRISSSSKIIRKEIKQQSSTDVKASHY